MRIVVAMSGGVDSSTAAALLVEQGHEVIGVAMKTHNLEPRANRACCTPDDMRDARRMAQRLDIPFYVINYAELFAEEVIRPFAEAYRRGQTPNPCVECNDKVKFKPLLERARQLNADVLATGHYARVERQGAQFVLRRGVDTNKDQSYFLYRLRQDQLAQLMFPLGDMCKEEVRRHAERLGLACAHKPESQEICFVGSEGYAATVESILGEGGRGGNFVSRDGAVLGSHSGIHHFTVGQRRGLGLSAPKPLYVTGIEPTSGDVHVGEREDLLTTEVVLEGVHWIAAQGPMADEVIGVQQRYREPPKAAVIEVLSDAMAKIILQEPQMRGAPGQAAVIYRGDEVVGGGTIRSGKALSSLSSRASLPVLGGSP
ncbi:MAG: tRNA 2-thiouridine(34) synthase MnmA [Myxococcota bacterium]